MDDMKQPGKFCEYCVTQNIRLYKFCSEQRKSGDSFLL